MSVSVSSPGMHSVLDQQVAAGDNPGGLQLPAEDGRPTVTEASTAATEPSGRVMDSAASADNTLALGQMPAGMERQASCSSDIITPFAAMGVSSPAGESTGSSITFTPWQPGALRDGMASDRGGRMYMEDRQVAVLDLKEHIPHLAAADLPACRAFFGEFDGHNGEGASQFAADNLLSTVLAQSSFPDDVEEALAAGFVKTDMSYEACLEDEGSGTTALSVIIWGRDMTIANLGDCRAVLSRRGRALDLSRDQKPSTDSERKRIVAAGGSVCPEGFLNGVLGVSRAIGNWHVRGHDDVLLKRRTHAETETPGSLHATAGPLISVPEISRHRLGPDDEFMVLATDGLWDVFSSQRCIEVARMLLQENNDPQFCAEGLIQRALDMHTTDNVSCQVICFGDDPPPSRRPSAFSGRRNLSVDSLSVLRTALGCAENTPTGNTSVAAPSPLSGGSTRWETIG